MTEKQELPKHGGPNSFKEAWRGLRKRKDTVHRRNQQIKNLKSEIEKLRNTCHGFKLRKEIARLEAENEKLTKTIEERGYAFQETVNHQLKEIESLKAERDCLVTLLEKLANASPSDIVNSSLKNLKNPFTAIAVAQGILAQFRLALSDAGGGK